MLLVPWLVGCESAGESATPNETCTVFAAASTTDLIAGIAAGYEESHATEVATSFAASSVLAQQIARGAQADVFASANRQWVDHLAEQHLVADSKVIAKNRLVVIVPENHRVEGTGLGILGSDRVKRIAIADPEGVPAGVYAKQALTQLDLWKPLRDKMVPAGDVRRALAYVETAAADAGIVYATDVAGSSRARIVADFPNHAAPNIEYVAVLVKSGENNPAARQFFKALSSPEAIATMKELGFVPATE